MQFNGFEVERLEEMTTIKSGLFFTTDDQWWPSLANIKYYTVNTIALFKTRSNIYDGAFWIINDWKIFTICPKHSILDVWQASIAVSLENTYFHYSFKNMLWNLVMILKELLNNPLGTQILLKKVHLWVNLNAKYF